MIADWFNVPSEARERYLIVDFRGERRKRSVSDQRAPKLLPIKNLLWSAAAQVPLFPKLKACLVTLAS